MYTTSRTYGDDPTGGDLIFSADGFVDGQQVPGDVADCSRAPGASAVNDAAWGRTKAGLAPSR